MQRAMHHHASNDTTVPFRKASSASKRPLKVLSRRQHQERNAPLSSLHMKAAMQQQQQHYSPRGGYTASSEYSYNSSAPPPPRSPLHRTGASPLHHIQSHFVPSQQQHHQSSAENIIPDASGSNAPLSWKEIEDQKDIEELQSANKKLSLENHKLMLEKAHWARQLDQENRHLERVWEGTRNLKQQLLHEIRLLEDSNLELHSLEIDAAEDPGDGVWEQVRNELHNARDTERQQVAVSLTRTLRSLRRWQSKQYSTLQAKCSEIGERVLLESTSHIHNRTKDEEAEGHTVEEDIQEAVTALCHDEQDMIFSVVPPELAAELVKHHKAKELVEDEKDDDDDEEEHEEITASS